MAEITTMWSISKANTKGVLERLDGKLCPNRLWFTPRLNPYTVYAVGSEVFASENEARSAAEATVAKRIASLEKTLAKMRKNPFAPSTPDTGRK